MGQLLIHLKRVLSINLRLLASRPTYLVAHRRASIGHTGNCRLSDEFKGRPANTTKLSVCHLNFSGRALDVEVGDLKGVFLNELPARLHHVAHQC